MNISMITAANSLNQIQKRIDISSHNIANLSTTGYKRREASFQDLLTQNILNQPHAGHEVGRSTPYGVRVGHGAMLNNPTIRPDQGVIQETGRELDWMIEGENSFFRILNTSTDRDGNIQEEHVYTRDGSFQLSPGVDGQIGLVTSKGQPVLGNDGAPITFNEGYDRIHVSSEGQVTVEYDGQEAVQFDLDVARINRSSVLEAIGDNNFRLTFDEEDLADEGVFTLLDNLGQNGPAQVRQGMLEMSNVELSQEMMDLLAAQRLMQFQSRSFSIANEMMGVANSIRS